MIKRTLDIHDLSFTVGGREVSFSDENVLEIYSCTLNDKPGNLYKLQYGEDIIYLTLRYNASSITYFVDTNIYSLPISNSVLTFTKETPVTVEPENNNIMHLFVSFTDNIFGLLYNKYIEFEADDYYGFGYVGTDTVVIPGKTENKCVPYELIKKFITKEVELNDICDIVCHPSNKIKFGDIELKEEQSIKLKDVTLATFSKTLYNRCTKYFATDKTYFLFENDDTKQSILITKINDSIVNQISLFNVSDVILVKTKLSHLSGSVVYSYKPRKIDKDKISGFSLTPFAFFKY
jgi:hypothetical protein